jgi:LysM repeat protein
MKLLSSRYAQIGLALIVAVILLAALSGSAAAAGPMYHTVRPGQTLYSIAGHYGVSVWAISCANGIYNPNYIYAGQVLYIPWGNDGHGCKQPQKPPVYHPDPCCKQPGYGDHVKYPQPNPCCEPQRPPVYHPDPCCKEPGYGDHVKHPYPNPFGCYYTVRWGDNLFRIALKYGLSWVQLAHANGLYNANYVYAGQVLRVPCVVY